MLTDGSPFSTLSIKNTHSLDMASTVFVFSNGDMLDRMEIIAALRTKNDTALNVYHHSIANHHERSCFRGTPRDQVLHVDLPGR